MGNSSTKEARPPSRNANRRSSDNTSSPSDTAEARPQLHGPRSSRHRQDGTFLGLGPGSGTPGSEPRRETRPEREARKAKKEQSVRLKERERSLREEGVDGGYLVTLGTYTGPEDFSKICVRQFMVERRLAPFWRGLNDHSDSWTEHQLVAAARGLPIPAPDEIPPELNTQSSLSPSQSIQTSPITFRTPLPGSSSNAALLPTRSANSGSALSSSPFLRGRSKTLASVTSKDDPQLDPTLQETKLPNEPQINGQPVEANLYKDVLECPICFLYYPPYLNRTRCCDQPICSECFVQIKRPDPHPPEHTDPNSPVPDEIRRLEEEGQLTSEPACCPFCVQAEFGITYEPPPFRRGLAYSNIPFSKSADNYSGSPAPHSNGTTLAPKRKRGQSVSVQAPGVISTDMVRPDWAEKLSSARSQAARRSAAATALHNAAYSMDGPFLRSAFGRRRRQYMLDSPNGAGDNGAVPGMNLEMLMAALGDPGSSRGRRHGHGEQISRRSSRADEIEELMMMEAIRQSLAAEEERSKKEEREAAKKAKKDQKAAVKDQKAADKAATKTGLYPSSSNASSMFSSPLSTSTTAQSMHSPEEGKGKSKASSPHNSASAKKLGFNLLNEPTSTLNTEGPSSSRGATNHVQSDTERSIFDAGSRPRQASAASSSGSSSNTQFSSSAQPSSQGANAGGPSVEGMFNFGSLAEMVGNLQGETSKASSADLPSRTRGGSDVIARSEPPQYEEEHPAAITSTQENQPPVIVEGRYDSKNYESERTFENVLGRQTTQ